jgi:hypothetical protein
MAVPCEKPLDFQWVFVIGVIEENAGCDVEPLSEQAHPHAHVSTYTSGSQRHVSDQNW